MLFDLPGPDLGGRTPNIDTISTQAAGAVFNALPVVDTSGFGVNTLNTGDNLTDTAGDGTLNFTTSPTTAGPNPPFATGVTLNDIKTANITTTLSELSAAFKETSPVSQW